MAKNKTQETTVKISDFIESFVEKESKKQDAYQLVSLMQQWSGFEAKMWGPSIIGFGSYHYKYASGHEGDAPLIGFSPRKAALSLYVFSPLENNKHLLENLGKYKISKACIYVNKLSDIDLTVLERLCKLSIKYIQENNECACRN